MRILSFFNKGEQTSRRIIELEKKIAKLEDEIKVNINVVNTKFDTIQANKDEQPSINIEHLQVDQIIIEKFDYANNFGQLGIKELTGKLNIGTSYEGDISKKIEEKMAEKLGKQPKVNLRSKEN